VGTGENKPFSSFKLQYLENGTRSNSLGISPDFADLGANNG